jgi:hypothetical protein
MKRSRFKEQQIIAILREQERGARRGGRVPLARAVLRSTVGKQSSAP